MATTSESKSSNRSDEKAQGLHDFLDIFQNCFITESIECVPEHIRKKAIELDSLKRQRNLEYVTFLKDVCIPQWELCQSASNENNGRDYIAQEVEGLQVASVAEEPIIFT